MLARAGRHRRKLPAWREHGEPQRSPLSPHRVSRGGLSDMRTPLRVHVCKRCAGSLSRRRAAASFGRRCARFCRRFHGRGIGRPRTRRRATTPTCPVRLPDPGMSRGLFATDAALFVMSDRLAASGFQGMAARRSISYSAVLPRPIPPHRSPMPYRHALRAHPAFR